MIPYLYYMRLIPTLCCSFFLAVSTQTAEAQTADAEKINKIKVALSEQADDTNKVTMLNDLAYLLSRTQPKNAGKYADTAIDLSRKLNFRHGLAAALDNRALCSNIVCDTAKARIAATECLTIAQETSDTFLQVMALTRFGYISFISAKQKEITRTYGLQALALAQASGNKRALAFAYMHAGFMLDKRREYALAVNADSLAMQFFDSLHDDYGRGGALGNLAHEYGVMGDYAGKAHIDSAALQILKAFGETEYYGLTLSSLSTALHELKQYNEALTACKEAIRINTGIGDKITIGTDYEQAAMTCYQLKQYPEGAVYIRQAIEIIQSAKGSKLELWMCRRIQKRIAKHMRS